MSRGQVLMGIVNRENPVVVAELTEMAGKMFGDLVKA